LEGSGRSGGPRPAESPRDGLSSCPVGDGDTRRGRAWACVPRAADCPVVGDGGPGAGVGCGGGLSSCRWVVPARGTVQSLGRDIAAVLPWVYPERERERVALYSACQLPKGSSGVADGSYGAPLRCYIQKWHVMPSKSHQVAPQNVLINSPVDL
jgi:hypothetical protein